MNPKEREVSNNEEDYIMSHRHQGDRINRQYINTNGTIFILVTIIYVQVNFNC